MQKEIKIIHFPKRNEPYVILAKPSGIPSAPINLDEKDNALSMAINYFPEIKNVSGSNYYVVVENGIQEVVTASGEIILNTG